MCHIKVVGEVRKHLSRYIKSFRESLLFPFTTLHFPEVFPTFRWVRERVGCEDMLLSHARSPLLLGTVSLLFLSPPLSSRSAKTDSLHTNCPGPSVSTQYHKLCRLMLAPPVWLIKKLFFSFSP